MVLHNSMVRHASTVLLKLFTDPPAHLKRLTEKNRQGQQWLIHIFKKNIEAIFPPGLRTDIDVFMEKEPTSASLGIPKNVSAAGIYSWDGRFIAAPFIYCKQLLQLSKGINMKLNHKNCFEVVLRVLSKPVGPGQLKTDVETQLR